MWGSWDVILEDITCIVSVLSILYNVSLTKYTLRQDCQHAQNKVLPSGGPHQHGARPTDESPAHTVLTQLHYPTRSKRQLPILYAPSTVYALDSGFLSSPELITTYPSICCHSWFPLSSFDFLLSHCVFDCEHYVHSPPVYDLSFLRPRRQYFTLSTHSSPQRRIKAASTIRSPLSPFHPSLPFSSRGNEPHPRNYHLFEWVSFERYPINLGNRMRDGSEDGVRTSANVALEVNPDPHDTSQHPPLGKIETVVCSKTSIVPPTCLNHITSKTSPPDFRDLVITTHDHDLDGLATTLPATARRVTSKLLTRN